MTLRDQVIANVQTVPALSSSIARLLPLVTDERTSAADFEDVIRPDPSLTANLLRMANSAALGLRHKVGTVRQAVTVLGTRTLTRIAASAAFAAVIPDVVPGYVVNAKAFCGHCVATAMFAEEMARHAGVPSPDGTFTAALMHDVGKLVVGSFLADQAARVNGLLQSECTAFVQVERQVLQADHAEIGAAIVARWGLPPPIVSAARWHHRPGETADRSHQMLVDLVHTANALAHALGFGADVGGMKRGLDERAVARTGLSWNALEQVACVAVEPAQRMIAAMT